MKNIESKITSRFSGFINTANSDGKFILASGPFYVSIESDKKKQELIIFSLSDLRFYSCSCDGYKYVVEKDGDWFGLSDGELIEFEDEKFILERKSKKFHTVTVIDKRRKGFDILNNRTGEKFEFQKASHKFVAEYAGNLYVAKNNMPKQIQCLDENYNTIKNFTFDGQGFSYINNKDRYIFYTIMDGEDHVLEVFDLKEFRPMCRSKNKIEPWFSCVYKIENLYQIFIGKYLYLWDGSSLSFHDFGAPIKAHLVKNDILVIGFENDSCLYVFNRKTLHLIRKKKVVMDGYHPAHLSESDGYIACLSCGNDGTLDHKKYFSILSDAEFFGDEELNVVVEHSIFQEREISDGESFSLEISVDASFDYIAVARQSIAALDDAIERHSMTIIASRNREHFSDGFNGKIAINFKGSMNLSAQQREWLILGLNNIINTFEVAYRGFNHGDPQPIQLSINFID